MVNYSQNERNQIQELSINLEKYCTLTKGMHHHRQISMMPQLQQLSLALFSLLLDFRCLAFRAVVVVLGPSLCSWSIFSIKRLFFEQKSIYREVNRLQLKLVYHLYRQRSCQPSYSNQLPKHSKSLLKKSEVFQSGSMRIQHYRNSTCSLDWCLASSC